MFDSAYSRTLRPTDSGQPERPAPERNTPARAGVIACWLPVSATAYARTPDERQSAASASLTTAAIACLSPATVFTVTD